MRQVLNDNDFAGFTGITMSLRLIGPTMGFIIAFGTLKMYINPLLTPLITNSDPRWMGAWWLGNLNAKIFVFFLIVFFLLK